MDIDLILKTGNFSNNKVKESLIKMNNKQIVNTIGEIIVTVYEVKYKYTTVRNNRKNGVKNFLIDSPSPEINMENSLENYIRNYNKENPSRQLSNVKFLEGQCLGFIRI